MLLPAILLHVAFNPTMVALALELVIIIAAAVVVAALAAATPTATPAASSAATPMATIILINSAALETLLESFVNGAVLLLMPRRPAVIAVAIKILI